MTSRPLPIRQRNQLLVLETSGATCLSLAISCLRWYVALRYLESAINPPESRSGGIECSSANQRSGSGRFRRSAAVQAPSRPEGTSLKALSRETPALVGRTEYTTPVGWNARTRIYYFRCPQAVRPTRVAVRVGSLRLAARCCCLAGAYRLNQDGPRVRRPELVIVWLNVPKQHPACMDARQALSTDVTITNRLKINDLVVYFVSAA